MFDCEVTHVPGNHVGYWIEEVDEPTFFAGHGAAIFLRLQGKEVRIGEFGILHPTVLEKFDLKYVGLPLLSPSTRQEPAPSNNPCG